MGDSMTAFSGPGPRVVILLGSKSDLEHRDAIARGLDRFDLTYETRIASAHRVTGYLLEMLHAYESDGQPRVYITVAGRSNALSGVVDANTRHPVIACPPYSDRYAGMDLLSTVRMPGGVAPLRAEPTKPVVGSRRGSGGICVRWAGLPSVRRSVAPVM